MKVICILEGGPDRWMLIGSKSIRFEDHPYCGPIVLSNKTGDPLENQPGQLDLFWLHYEAWVANSKKVKTVLGKSWCDYETSMQNWRRQIADMRKEPPNAK